MDDLRLCKTCGIEKLSSDFRGNWRTCKSCISEKRKQTHQKTKQDNDNILNLDLGEPKKIDIELPQESEIKISEPKKNEPVNQNQKMFTMDKKHMKDATSKTLQGIFEMVGEGLGDYWKLKDHESNLIADPLTDILSDLEYSDKIGENMKYISLGIACFTVFTPKIMKQLKSRKGKVKSNVREFKKPSTDNKTENNNSSGQNNSTTVKPINRGVNSKISFTENGYTDDGGF